MWNWKDETKLFEVDLESSGFLNMGYEISDKMCEKGYAKKTAIIWKSKSGNERKLTFEYLANESSRLANHLKNLGAEKESFTFIYMDKIPELYISIIAVLKIGSIAGPLFSSFGTDAIRDRLFDSKASIIITQSSLLPNVLAVCDFLPNLKHIIVVKENDNNLPYSSDKSITDFKEYLHYDCWFECEKTSPDDSALIHYTSGTTGKPKGAIHSHSSIVAHYSTAKHVLQLKDDDIYWCTADPAWITGTSYGIFGPMSNGITQVSLQVNIRPNIFYETIDKYKISVVYTAPTLLRMLMREKDELIGSFNLKSLRHVASVGEALNPEVIKWFNEKTGLLVHDTWFQTETGCILIANTLENEIKPGSMGKPIPPVEAEILDDYGQPLPAGQTGSLAIKSDWPSMFKTYWGKEATYMSKFKGKWYITGDNASKDSNGYFWFSAREDDVINTAGHLVSPFEVESALLEHPSVSESAAVGIPDKLLSEKIKTFIVLKSGETPSGQLKIELRTLVRKAVSPFAVPQEIEIVETLPRTRSGKIMRRLLKSRELGLEEGDVSTLEKD